MSSRDIRDILDIKPATPGAQPKKAAPLAMPGAGDKPVNRPTGITRELYALMGDNAPALALSQTAKPKFKDRLKRPGKSTKWKWMGFTLPTREKDVDDEKERELKGKLTLHHWVKEGYHVDGGPDTKFVPFNTKTPVYVYTDEEYETLLQDPDWTREETDYLIEMAQLYDLRFPVMLDRWESERERTIDDLKFRYYTIARRLIRARPAADENARQALLSHLVFDKHREAERKTYLRSLLNRTPQQIAEEQFLYVETRRIEQSYNKVTAERADLLRMLAGREGINSPGRVQFDSSGNLIKPTKDVDVPLEKVDSAIAQLPEGWAGEGGQRHPTKIQDSLYHIERHPKPTSLVPRNPTAAVLRSTKIPVPKSAVAPKVHSILAEMGISSKLVMPTKNNIQIYDSLINGISEMLELKKAVDKLDSEIRIQQKRKAALGGEEELPDDEKDLARNKRSASYTAPSPAVKKRRD